MLEINYDNTIDEVRDGYIRFYFKYMLWRMIAFSLVYLIAFVFGVNFIATAPDQYYGYILVALGGGLIFAQWVKPFNIRRRMVRTLEGLNPERYTARFFDDRIEIETEIVQPGETEVVAVTGDGVTVVENAEIIEEVEKREEVRPEKSVIGLQTEDLFSAETPGAFLLYVNRALIYIFPKRCLTGEQAESLDRYFQEKAI